MQNAELTIIINRHSEGAKRPWESPSFLLKNNNEDCHVTSFLAMTRYIYSSWNRSFHIGLWVLISSSFRFRDQLLICFSLAIACSILPNSSKCRSCTKLYFAEKPPKEWLRCWCIRWTISDVTPVYNVVCNWLEIIYTHGFFILLLPNFNYLIAHCLPREAFALSREVLGKVL